MTHFDLEQNERLTFLYGQLELYKIEFANTGNNKYLDVMNELHKTINFIKSNQTLLEKIILDNQKLKAGIK